MFSRRERVALARASNILQMRVLQCVTVCCSMLQCVVVCCRMLQCAAVCCSVLQCAAVCCSVLQCVAVCCSVLSCTLQVSHARIRTNNVLHICACACA